MEKYQSNYAAFIAAHRVLYILCGMGAACLLLEHWLIGLFLIVPVVYSIVGDVNWFKRWKTTTERCRDDIQNRA